MLRGELSMAALAGVLATAASAWGQASFGPIQPFAGAPTPVYVAGPYAAPTALAPIGAPAFGAPAFGAPTIIAPPAAVSPPIVTPGTLGAAIPQYQAPAATFPPSLGAAPGAFAAPAQTVVASPSCCGGGSQHYRPLLGSPTTSYSPYAAPGNGYYGQSYGQPLPSYGH